MQKRAVFWMGVARTALGWPRIYSDILQNAPFRTQIFEIFFASGGKGALTFLTKILRTLSVRVHQVSELLAPAPWLVTGRYINALWRDWSGPKSHWTAVTFLLSVGEHTFSPETHQNAGFWQKCQKNIFGGATPGIPRHKGPPLQPPRPSPRFQTPAF